MTFASIIHCPLHISPKPAASLLMQRKRTATELCVFGSDVCDFIGRNSEISDNLYWANLPTG